jgi:hypothetical protein
MESHKGDPIKNLDRSYRILSRYPAQVAVLKGARAIIAMQDAGLVERHHFVDHEQTKGFAEFCLNVRRAAAGDGGLQKAVKLLADEAQENFAGIERDAAAMGAVVREIGKTLPVAMAKQLRSGGPLPSGSAEIISNSVLQIAAMLIKSNPATSRVPSSAELRERLIFRHALASYLLALRWIEDGGIAGAAVSKLRNDLIDASCVAYATFFDGILSNDRKMCDVYKDAVWLLDHLFA